MKRFALVVGMMVALGWSRSALAQAITCTSLANFVCAYSAAETLALVASKSAGSPGQPAVYVGYLSFDSTGTNVTMTGTSDVNGTVTPNFSLTGTCAPAPAALQPATILFNDKSQISFVTDSSETELQFILSQDKNTPANSTTSNSVRLGVCRKQ